MPNSGAEFYEVREFARFASPQLLRNVVLKSISALTSIYILLFLSSLSAFLWGLRGQKLEIKLPPFTVYHHFHHFAWVKSQAIPFKILDVIDNIFNPFIVYVTIRN